MNRVLLVAGLAIFTFGCGGKSPTTFDAKTIEASDGIRKVATAYNKAYAAKRRAPTMEELKQHLKPLGDPDTLLTSPRDGKPLVIVMEFSPDIEQTGNEQPIIAYEQEGVDGKRMTVDSRGTVVFYTDAEFAKIKFVGGHQPAR